MRTFAAAAIGAGLAAASILPAQAVTSHYLVVDSIWYLESEGSNNINQIGTSADAFAAISQGGGWYRWEDDATGQCLTFEGSGTPYYVYEASCASYPAAESWNYTGSELINEQASDNGQAYCMRSQSLTNGAFVVVGSCSGAAAEWSTPDS